MSSRQLKTRRWPKESGEASRESRLPRFFRLLCLPAYCLPRVRPRGLPFQQSKLSPCGILSAVACTKVSLKAAHVVTRGRALSSGKSPPTRGSTLDSRAAPSLVFRVAKSPSALPPHRLKSDAVIPSKTFRKR